MEPVLCTVLGSPAEPQYVAKLSRWIIYDQQFRHEAADAGNTKWDRVDSSQCFTGMSLCEEGWCSLCASLDHVQTTYPFKPPVDYYRRPPSEGHQPPSDYQRPPLARRPTMLRAGGHPPNGPDPNSPQMRHAKNGTDTTTWTAAMPTYAQTVERSIMGC